MTAKSNHRLFPTLAAVFAPGRRSSSLIFAFICICTALVLAAFVSRDHAFFALSPDGGGGAQAQPAAVIQPRLAGAGTAQTGVRQDAEDRRYRAIASFLAQRYRVSQDVTLDLVGIAHSAGRQLGLDPLLIIAVIAVESRFNPIAESVAGAKGLMQVIPRYHGDKLREFGGENSVFDPRANILVGSRILKEYLSRTGNLSIALQMYAGALNDSEDVYTERVMREKARLRQVVTVPEARTAGVLTAPGQPAAQRVEL